MPAAVPHCDDPSAGPVGVVTHRWETVPSSVTLFHGLFFNQLARSFCSGRKKKKQGNGFSFSFSFRTLKICRGINGMDSNLAPYPARCLKTERRRRQRWLLIGYKKRGRCQTWAQDLSSRPGLNLLAEHGRSFSLERRRLYLV